jgi:hypothetical protein
MLGWHFLAQDRKLAYRDGRTVEAGQTYTVPNDKLLLLCQYGLHACKKVLDALQYAKGPIVCRVELIGKIEHDTDKSVAYKRRVLAMLDATNILHEFACLCAEDALKLVKNPDPRSIAAIKAKRDWVAGKITDKELVAARDAAKDAAWDAAWAAAWGAARDADRDAARDAAWDAARAAARDAAWDAARGAARRAAWGAARDAQNKRLTSMIKSVLPVMVRQGG